MPLKKDYESLGIGKPEAHRAMRKVEKELDQYYEDLDEEAEV